MCGITLSASLGVVVANSPTQTHKTEQQSQEVPFLGKDQQSGLPACTSMASVEMGVNKATTFFLTIKYDFKDY